MAKGKSSRLMIDGERYRATVLLVTSSDPDGRPRECSIVYDDESVTVRDGLEFVIVYMPEKIVRKDAN